MRFPAVITVIACLALAAIALPAISAPTIEFQSTKFDIGKPFEGQMIKLRYDFKNVGDAELEIKEVKAGCGCTEAKATQTKIAPGQSAAVEGVFNTAGYRTQLIKTIDVITNDPVNPTVKLELSGEVLAIADFKPQYSLNLGNLKPGAVSVNEITLTPKLQQKYSITKIDSNGKLVTITRFDKSPNKDGDYVIELKVDVGKRSGRFYEQLSIMTDLPGNPSLKFPVYGNVEGDTSTPVAPVSSNQSPNGETVVLPMAVASELPDGPVIEFEKTTVDIGKVLEGSKTKVLFPFKNTGVADLKITKVAAMCGCTVAKATQTVVPAGKSAAIEIVFDSTGFKSGIEKPVLVGTNDQSHKSVRLVVLGEVKPIATLKPEALNFGQMGAGDTSTVKLVITPMPSMKFKILKAETTGSLLSIVQFTKIPDKKGLFAATIKVKAGSSMVGKVQGKARFITDLPGNPAISFQVFGNIAGSGISKNAKTL